MIVPSATVNIDDVAKAVAALATEHGGAATVAQLRDKLGLPERTLQRALGRLVARGEVFRLSRGRYADRASGASPSNAPAREIVRVIKHLEADAHLSGYDVLAGFTHQFVFDYPHLVCCHPSHADGLAAALAKRRFVVLPAGPAATIDAALQKTVLLRRQPTIHSRALAQGAIATPEKAWVDLLRETRRSAAPFDYGELGRLLRAMSEQTLNLRALRSYAARLGYQDWLSATIGQLPPNGPAQRRLAAGYAA